MALSKCEKDCLKIWAIIVIGILIFFGIIAFLNGCGGGFRVESTHGTSVAGVPMGGTTSPTPTTTLNAVSGTVFDNSSGDRLEGATVSLYIYEGTVSQKILATNSESNGLFTFSGLVPDNYYFIYCEKSGYGETRYPAFDNEFFQIPLEGKYIEIYLTQDQGFNLDLGHKVQAALLKASAAFYYSNTTYT